MTRHEVHNHNKLQPASMAMSDSPRSLSWPLPTAPTPTQSSSEKINPYHAAYIRQPPLFPTKGDVKGSSSSTTSSVSQIRDLLPLRLDSWTKNNYSITDQNLETRLGVLENALENGLGALENTFKNGLGALENALKNIADDLLQVKTALQNARAESHADMKSTKEELLYMKNAVQNARAQSQTDIGKIYLQQNTLQSLVEDALEAANLKLLDTLKSEIPHIFATKQLVPLVARTPTLMATADDENHRGTLELTMADGKNDSTIVDQGLLDIGLTLSGPEDFPEVGLTASGLEESENTIREIWNNLISIEDTTQALQSNNRKMEKMRKIKAKKARIATGQ
ncbi:unnamed protein product [Sphagnum balticum]